MTRAYRHLTPRYLVNRLRSIWYHRAHPGQPWLTPESIEFLDRNLPRDGAGLEFGSGGSTAWFGQRLARLTSVEHNVAWYEKVIEKIKQAGLTNVELLLVAVDQRGPDGRQAYAATPDRFAPESLDFVLVDGKYREACILAALPLLRPGGLLVLDDAQRYLPSKSHSPYARTPQDGPASPSWQEFTEKVRDWRQIWTSNGVSDTVIFIRPAA